MKYETFGSGNLGSVGHHPEQTPFNPILKTKIRLIYKQNAKKKKNEKYPLF
jgi:hypothetical protein